jgi:hypothetical protein
MATTFLKRQKEIKRQEKQREKAESRRQKKLAKRTGSDSPGNIGPAETDPSAESSGAPNPDPEN